MTRFIGFLLLVMAVLPISGCTGNLTVSQTDITELNLAIQALGPEVDSREAERAATIAYRYSLQLARQYNITDSPVIHNAKVKNGLRERGLCNHFVEDIQKRMLQEGFRTLNLHWAASLPKRFQIPHYTAVVSQRGDTIDDGIVLDPWRYGGVLYWSQTGADEQYEWRPL